MTGPDASAGRASGSFLWLVVVFALLGPLVGGVTFWFVIGPSQGLLEQFSDVWKLAIGGLAVSIAFMPLGMVQAIITGVISGFVSRGTLSAGRWIIYSSVVGAAASAVSLPTVFLVFVQAHDHSALAAVGTALWQMAVVGAVAGAVCASISVRLRPGRSLPPQSS